MPDFLQNLRLQNLFAPQNLVGTGTPYSPPMDFTMGNDLPSQGGIMGNMPPPMGENMFQPTEMTPTELPQPDQGFDPIAVMNELYQPETAASERFQQLMGQYPERERPGFWRTAAAALSAFGPGGHEMGMQVLNQPYQDKLERWKSLIDPAEAAANLERYENVNRRQLATQGVAERRRDAQLKINEDKQALAELKFKNPNLQFNTTGPTVLTLDPSTGEVKDTEFPTGRLSKIDELMLGQQFALDRIDRNVAGRKEVADVVAGHSMDRAEYIQGEIARRQGANTTQERPLSPSAEEQQWLNNARLLKERNPELGQYINITGNDFTIEEPASYLGGYIKTGPPPEIRQQIIDTIFGSDETDREASELGMTPETPLAPTTPTTRVISREEAIEALRNTSPPIEVNEENIRKAMDPANWIQ